MLRKFLFTKIIGALAAVLVFFIGQPLTAADQDLFDVYSLEVEGVIHGHVTGDFDGDNLIDIGVIYSTFSDREKRYIGLYLQRAASGFSRQPAFLIELTSTAAQINAGDIDDDGRDEILIIDSDGVSASKYVSGSGFSSPERIIGQATLFTVPIFYGIITDPFMFSINDEPGPEIMVPFNKGYIIYERGENGVFEILNQLSVPISGHISPKSMKEFIRPGCSSFKIDLAQIQIADGNLDGRPDIYFLWNERVCSFFQDATGNYSPSPEVRVDFFPSGVDGFIRSQLKDVNGDRRPDIVVSYTSGGITNTETRVRIFMSSSSGRIESNYSKEINLSDSHCNLLIDDFNGDGQPDLVLPAVELGAMAATKMLLLKKTDLHLLIYPFNNGVLANEPVRRIEYEFRFNFDDSQPTEEVSINWSADFNGDNLLDLVFSDGKGEINLFWGDAAEYLSKKSDLEISLDRAAQVYPLHLNNGTFTDMIVHHKLTGKVDRLTVLKNRNNK